MKNGRALAYPLDAGAARHFGLTKRELFAAMAMQSLASVPSPGGRTTSDVTCDIELAVTYADALLAELERTA